MRMFAVLVAATLVLALTFTSPAPAAAQAAPAPAAKTAVTALLNLNTATAAQLEKLPGIGPRTAARIVEYRQKNGAFKKPEELMNVKGMGEKSFLRIKNLVTVTAAGPDAP